MSYIFPALLFCFSANMDNIALGISYGIKEIHIPIKYNLILSCLTSIITCVTMLFANTISKICECNLSNFASFALVTIGVISCILTYFKTSKEESKSNNKKYEYDKKNTSNNKIEKITIKDSCILSLTLSINNMAVGIAAALTGINISISFMATFIFSFVFLLIGNTLGKSFAKKFVLKYSDYISALLFILLGIFQYIF